MVHHEYLCFHCMGRLDVPGMVCPHCGHDNRFRRNDEGYLGNNILVNQYYVGRALGRGGFGVTYIGFDLNLERVVAIKEYFPASMAVRENGSYTMRSYSGSGDDYRRGCERALEEGRMMARTGQVNGVAQVYNVFQANNTVYIVMEYIQGTTLGELTKLYGGVMPWRVLLTLMEPLMRSLHMIHGMHIIHRDISPDNVMIRAKNGEAVLLDFGAAHTFSDHTSSEHSVSLRLGYAPAEQYSRTGQQDGRIDEYALCATMYYALTGVKPPDATERLFAGTQLQSLTATPCGISPKAEATLFKGMAVMANDRYPDVETLRRALLSCDLPDASLLENVVAVMRGGGVYASANVQAAQPVEQSDDRTMPDSVFSNATMPDSMMNGATLPESMVSQMTQPRQEYVPQKPAYVPQQPQRSEPVQTPPSSVVSQTPESVVNSAPMSMVDSNPVLEEGIQSEQKKKKSPVRLVGLILLAGAVACGLYWMNGSKDAPSSASGTNPASSIQQTQDVSKTTNPPAGLQYGVKYTTTPNDDGTVTLSKLENATGEVILPSVINGKTVTVLGPELLYENVWVTSVVIPDTVKTIHTTAFAGCTKLTKVVIPSSVTEIGPSSFNRCPSLVIHCAEGSYAQQYAEEKNINYVIDASLPVPAAGGAQELVTNGFTGKVENGSCVLTGYTGSDVEIYVPSAIDGHPVSKLGIGLFKNQTQITGVIIPEGVTEIDAEAFAGCTNLILVAVPDSVNVFANSAFDNCPKLTLMGNSGSGAEKFANRNGIPFVAMDQASGDTQTAAGQTSENASAGFTGTVTDAGEYILNTYTGSDVQVTVPAMHNDYYVTRLGQGLFANQTQLTGVIVPNGVVKIDASAFAGCTNLELVVLPDSLQYCAGDAFLNCARLTIMGNAGGAAENTAQMLQLPFMDVNTGKLTDYRASSQSTLPEFDYALNADGTCAIVQYNGSKTEAVIPSSIDGHTVVAIGNSAFENASNVTSLTVPSSVTTIGSYAFKGCSSLKTIKLEGATTIGAYAFANCSALSEFTMATKAEVTIDDNAFSGTKIAKVYAQKSSKAAQRLRKLGFNITAISN